METYIGRQIRKEEIEAPKAAKSGTVIIHGELDEGKAYRIKDEVEKLKSQGINMIVVDLRGMTSLTLFGIGMLKALLSDLESDEDEIWITGLTERFKLLFKRFGYSRIRP